MGRASRPKPIRLAEKLRHVRVALELSQSEMLDRLGLGGDDSSVNRTSISSYELDLREPPLPVLLAYARAANVFVDALIDDDAELPDRLPADVKGAGS